MRRPLPIVVAAHSTGWGTGWWLSEWLWQPGNDAADRLVFHAFAANFVILLAPILLTTVRAFREPTRLGQRMT